MKYFRAASFGLALLGALACHATPSLADAPLAYDEAWWQTQYAKLYDKPECQALIPTIEKMREFDRFSGQWTAPMVWALGLYGAKGECADPAQDDALAILTDLAGRGEGFPAVYLAQLYHVEEGADSPLTQDWMQRTKNAIPRIITENWREDFYQPVVNGFKEMGAPISPQLNEIFAWGEGMLNGAPDPLYEHGMALLEHGKNPEDKVLACRWLYAAERKGHAQARYRFAQLHILGENIIRDPGVGMSWLHISVNEDRNVDALIFLSTLLEKGDVFRQDLTDAYAALLRAKKMGADVTLELARLRDKLSNKDIGHAEWLVDQETALITFGLSDSLKKKRRSGSASPFCQFLP